MMTRRLVLGLALCAAAAAAAAPGGSSAPAGGSSDEQLLKTAQVGTDGPSLLAYFRQRTVGENDRQRIEALIRQLGDPAYAVRERASAELSASGLPAIGPLRQALNDADVEVVRRAERCLERIEKVPSTALSAAAARLIAQRKPAGAVGALLAYLPVADDETVPIFEFAGHASALSWVTVHLPGPFGLPTRPAGSRTTVLLTSSDAAE